MSLLPTKATLKVARVLSFGAKKYGDHNWLQGMRWTRLSSACLRHLFAWIGGEDKDPESGISHLAHAACNLLMLLEYEERGIGENDRWKQSITKE